MKLQTMFEPVTIREVGPYTLLKSKELQKLLRRLYNAESGFDYATRREIPRIQSSRDAHMLNAVKQREENKALIHDLERQMEIANIECNRAEDLHALLDDVFDFLGGCDGASELRSRILAAQGIEAQRAETVEQGPVHESPVGAADAPKTSRPPETPSPERA